MGARPPKICIVTPDHLGISSRTVKEADALNGAGFEVTVVFGRGGRPQADAHDAHLLKDRTWRAVVVGWGRDRHLYRWMVTGLRQRLSQLASQRCAAIPFAGRSLGRVYPELARRAAAQRADLYIGHFAAGLAAAGWAARHTGAMLAFDAEDFHLGEGASGFLQRAVAAIQDRYLPTCEYLSSSSGAIGAELKAMYPSLRLVTIYNVLSPSDFPSISDSGPLGKRGVLSLYWVSQTIGMDRGLQDAIRAMALLERPVELHLRGTPGQGAGTHLRALAASLGVEPLLHFHPQLPSWEVPGDAARHDAGLALEQPATLNRDLCATIKLFLYLSAGLAIAATETTGQQEVLSQAPGVGALYPPGDHVALAAILRRWQEEPSALASAKKASLEAARTRYNWEHESRKLVAVAEDVLQRGRREDMGGAKPGTRIP